MAQKIVQIDAFTHKPFAGNPAAVCLMEKAADETWMQAVAAEMNLSETAFLSPIDRGYHLRWFTPTVEAELCGHATLASAHLLYEDGHVASDQPIRFETLGGELTASHSDGWIELDFPVTPCSPSEPPAGLHAALGAEIKECRSARHRLLVELESEATIRNLHPNFSAIAGATDRRVIVTARAITAGLDFVSRYFAPSIGINEDPVTGSAHTVLAPYWADKLKKTSFTAFQASARGGWLKVRLKGDRVLLGGQAVTVMRGELS